MGAPGQAGCSTRHEKKRGASPGPTHQAHWLCGGWVSASRTPDGGFGLGPTLGKKGHLFLTDHHPTYLNFQLNFQSKAEVLLHKEVKEQALRGCVCNLLEMGRFSAAQSAGHCASTRKEIRKEIGMRNSR